MLDYYATDYTPIGGSGADVFRSGKNGSGYGGNIIDLFNGNISGMTTTLKEPMNYTIHPQGTEYYYDQLNRLVEMNVYQDLDRTTNDWDTESPLTDYHEEYTYDANGNILSLLRNGHNTVNTQMDDLAYNYATNNNKLLHVDDAVSAGNYSTDIDDQAANNYDYDQIGNLIEDVAEEIANIDWTVYGKVKSVTRTMLSTKPELMFTYGPDGQRVTKKVDDGTDIISTYYVRDASGNIMATYKYIDHSASPDEFLLEEHHIYGSTRLGTRQKQTDLLTSPTIPPDQTGIIYVERGYKRFELSNHLGNVLSVVSDRRQQGACTGDIVDYYEADIINVQDYYPFGMTMPEREWNNGDYRFGFNGKESDDETYGDGNCYDYGFRIYNPRLGRFLSVDPLFMSFPWVTPYQFAFNRPIEAVDLDGLESDDENGQQVASDPNEIVGVGVLKDIYVTPTSNAYQGPWSPEWYEENGVDNQPAGSSNPFSPMFKPASQSAPETTDSQLAPADATAVNEIVQEGPVGPRSKHFLETIDIWLYNLGDHSSEDYNPEVSSKGGFWWTTPDTRNKPVNDVSGDPDGQSSPPSLVGGGGGKSKYRWPWDRGSNTESGVERVVDFLDRIFNVNTSNATTPEKTTSPEPFADFKFNSDSLPIIHGTQSGNSETFIPVDTYKVVRPDGNTARVRTVSSKEITDYK